MLSHFFLYALNLTLSLQLGSTSHVKVVALLTIFHFVIFFYYVPRIFVSVRSLLDTLFKLLGN